MTATLYRRCAWCEQWLGEPPDATDAQPVVTHTICPDCTSNLEFQNGVSVQRYLDDLAVPVMLVDGDVVVKALNRAAREMAGKESEQILECRCGDVYECAYARLPNGCGTTTFCSGCAIRRSVTHTYATGESVFRRPARLRQGDCPGDSAIALYVSTYLVDGYVLLRIDRVDAT